MRRKGKEARKGVIEDNLAEGPAAGPSKKFNTIKKMGKWRRILQVYSNRHVVKN